MKQLFLYLLCFLFSFQVFSQIKLGGINSNNNPGFIKSPSGANIDPGFNQPPSSNYTLFLNSLQSNYIYDYWIGNEKNYKDFFDFSNYQAKTQKKWEGLIVSTLYDGNVNDIMFYNNWKITTNTNTPAQIFKYWTAEHSKFGGNKIEVWGKADYKGFPVNTSYNSYLTFVTKPGPIVHSGVFRSSENFRISVLEPYSAKNPYQFVTSITTGKLTYEKDQKFYVKVSDPDYCKNTYSFKLNYTTGGADIVPSSVTSTVNANNEKFYTVAFDLSNIKRTASLKFTCIPTIHIDDSKYKNQKDENGLDNPLFYKVYHMYFNTRYELNVEILPACAVYASSPGTQPKVILSKAGAGVLNQLNDYVNDKSKIIPYYSIITNKNDDGIYTMKADVKLPNDVNNYYWDLSQFGSSSAFSIISPAGTNGKISASQDLIVKVKKGLVGPMTFTPLKTYSDNEKYKTCLLPEELIVLFGGQNTTLDKHCLINVQDDLIGLNNVLISDKLKGTVNYTGVTITDLKNIALQHIKWRFYSDRGVVLDPSKGDIILEDGAELDVYAPQVFNGNEKDQNKNWIQSVNYDENGNVLSESRNYFDNLGYKTQSQIKNLSDHAILASQIVYDSYNRPALNTLLAPIDNVFYVSDPECGDRVPIGGNYSFNYKDNFITSKTTPTIPYGISNFDVTEKVQKPDGVSNTTQGTLGWYYGPNNWGAQRNLYENFSINEFVTSDGQFGNPSYKRTYGIDAFVQPSIGTDGEVKYITIASNSIVFKDGFQLSGNQIDGYTATIDPNHVYMVRTKGESISEDFVPESEYPFSRTIFNDADGSGDPKSYVLPGNIGWEKGHFDDSEILPIDGTEDILKKYLTIREQQILGNSTYTEGNKSMQGKGYIKHYKDVNNIESYGYYDTEGRLLVSESVLSSGESEYSMSFYDNLGRLVTSLSPNGYNSFVNGTTWSEIDKETRIYDDLGELIESTSKDEGIVTSLYRSDGKIRFSQNQKQKTDRNCSYINYDEIGRIIETGELYLGSAQFPDDFQLVLENTEPNKLYINQWVSTYNSDGGTILSGGPAGDFMTGGSDGLSALPNGVRTLEATSFVYDTPVLIPAKSGAILPDNQKGMWDQYFIRGRVAYSRKRDPKTNLSETWYSYDYQGRVSWMAQQLYNSSTVINDPSNGLKRVDYTYNAQGNVSRVEYEPFNPNENFRHDYTYDNDGRLISTFVSNYDFESNKVKNIQKLATYDYYLHGPLKRTELANKMQGIDYVYTIQGWLKSMNNPDKSFDPGKDGNDLFAMSLEYFSGDYVNHSNIIESVPNINPLDKTKEKFDGTITAMRWNTENNGTFSSFSNNPLTYNYTYDSKYQLTDATLSLWNRTLQTNTKKDYAYKWTPGGYDMNGNIKSLLTYPGNATQPQEFSDNFDSYNYINNTNKLWKVEHYGTFAYNEIGQNIEEQHVDGKMHYYYNYDVSGNLTHIFDNEDKTSLVAQYYYNEQGKRYRVFNAKDNSNTYYIYDASGSLLNMMTAKSDKKIYQSSYPLYGAGKVGLANRDYLANAIPHPTYELSDHLGNVHIVFDGEYDKGKLSLISATDYYPGGATMPGRSYHKGLTKYPFGYQGQYALDNTYENTDGKQDGFFHFDARNYNPRIARWTSPDAAHQYWSPYLSMGNNWGNSVDPDGNTDYINKNTQEVMTDVGWFGSMFLDHKIWIDAEEQDVVVTPVGKSALEGNLPTPPLIAGTDAWYARASGRIEVSDIQPQEILLLGIIAASRSTSVAVVDMEASTVSKSINVGKQGKHIIGNNNYIEGKSILTKDAQSLLDAFHSGNVKSVQVINNVKTRVDFGKNIGFYIKQETGEALKTTRGIIINSKTGAHIVPSAP